MVKKVVDVYNMTSDTNFGPHHDGDLLTLACCMVQIRRKVGDLWKSMSNPEKNLEYWIVGRVASSLNSKKKNHLIYFMKVDDVMIFDEYSDEFGLRGEVNGRKDNLYRFNGDNDDYFDPKNYEKVIDEDILPKHIPSHDIGKGKYVLLSENYCYFDWKNDPYSKILDEWGIPELKWIPSGKEGPFRRKYDFEDTEAIIEKLKEIKRENCQKFIPNKEGGDGCGGCSE